MLVRWPVSLAERSDRERKLKSLQKLENPSHDNRSEKTWLCQPATLQKSSILSFRVTLGRTNNTPKGMLAASQPLSGSICIPTGESAEREAFAASADHRYGKYRLPVAVGANSHRVATNIRRYRLR